VSFGDLEDDAREVGVVALRRGRGLLHLREEPLHRDALRQEVAAVGRVEHPAHVVPVEIAHEPVLTERDGLPPQLQEGGVVADPQKALPEVQVLLVRGRRELAPERPRILELGEGQQVLADAEPERDPYARQRERVGIVPVAPEVTVPNAFCAQTDLGAERERTRHRHDLFCREGRLRRNNAMGTILRRQGARSRLTSSSARPASRGRYDVRHSDPKSLALRAKRAHYTDGHDEETADPATLGDSDWALPRACGRARLLHVRVREGACTSRTT
jgi:hypothetical protein